MNIERGTKPYMAPEIILEGKLNYATMDVDRAGVNLKFAQKLSFLFSSEFAALGIQLRYGKIIFYLFSLFLPF